LRLNIFIILKKKYVFGLNLSKEKMFQKYLKKCVKEKVILNGFDKFNVYAMNLVKVYK